MIRLPVRHGHGGVRAGSITGRRCWTLACTITTPTPTPTVTPRGELSATKTSIDVGEEVTVSAVNVFPSSQSVYIVTNGQLDFARHGSCHVETGPRSSRALARSWTLEGCSPPGSGSVTLKTRHNGNTVILDSITIDVSPPPTATPTTAPTATTTPDTVPTATSTGPVTEPTATTTPQSGTVPVLPGQPIDQVPVPPDQTSPSQVAYRWLRVTWDAPSVYIRFKVESRDAHGNWGELQPVVRGEPKAGPRVITDHANRTADVRGLPHSTTTPVSFRITGVTASDVERTSAEVTITQRPAPQAIGHQHDHTVAYDLSRLPTSGLGHTIGSLAVGAADAWDRLPLVQLCSPDCPENSDRAIIYVELHENSPNACRSHVACVEWLSTIEDRIATTTMIYENPPYSSSGTQWQWTRHESLHRQLDISSGLRWLYLDAVVLHEFGHTLGLPDVEKPSHYVGIMRKGVPTTEMTTMTVPSCANSMRAIRQEKVGKPESTAGLRELRARWQMVREYTGGNSRGRVARVRGPSVVRWVARSPTRSRARARLNWVSQGQPS